MSDLPSELASLVPCDLCHRLVSLDDVDLWPVDGGEWVTACLTCQEKMQA